VCEFATNQRYVIEPCEVKHRADVSSRLYHKNSEKQNEHLWKFTDTKP
jgi:hypothetical protein